MAESVMVVAGMLGNTVASTAWIRCQPGTRPRRSVCKPRGAAFMGKLPPLWKLRPGLSDLEHHRERQRPGQQGLFAELEHQLANLRLGRGIQFRAQFQSLLAGRRVLLQADGDAGVCWE